MALQNKKSLGQNWLKNRDILLDIADTASAEGVETVVEIGPGLGTLTSALFKFFDKVISIEFDDKLAANLPKSFPGKNLQVIHDDVLKVDIDALDLPEKYVVAGNIPYYITSPIIEKFLSVEHKPKKIVFLIQKEVAERIVAEQGDHTILSLAAQNKARVSLGALVKREFFTPPPKVDSQVIILEPYEKPQVSDQAIALAKLGFSSPRKKLISNLVAALRMPKEEIEQLFEKMSLNPDARPSDLDLFDWEKLAEAIAK
jgi:16S rRNA (adenine1518-N6/adenine1519-N6)-dimethyltransferase